jgi:hypothetical protein
MEKETTLPLVKERGEIQRNAVTLGGYLDNTNSIECEYAKSLIEKGKCFVIVASPKGYRFYPSRFMGYAGNSMEAHEKMGEIKRRTGKITRDGRTTNQAISRILGDLIERGDGQWARWETEYQIFCKKLGVIPYHVERKYWDPINQT